MNFQELESDQPWPSWVKEFRPHQQQALEEIKDAYDGGAKVVFLDAPTGSGKTLIGEATRRMLQRPAIYLSSSLTLQDQFARDFEYASVIKGRSNYPTLMTEQWPDLTAADCTKADGECDWCGYDVENCPYEIAKTGAINNSLACLNSTYFVIETNKLGFASKFKDRELAILDECDVIEDELMRFVEFYVGAYTFKDLHIEPPDKGIHKETIGRYISNVLIPALATKIRIISKFTDVKTLRKKGRYKRLLEDAKQIIVEISDKENWVRDNKAGPLVLKPISVQKYGTPMLWDKANKWLAMSATVISADFMAKSLGLEDSYEVVRVPMTFPVENRPIYVTRVANMTAKTEEAEMPKMVQAIRNIATMHPGERILIHTVSYGRAATLMNELHINDRRVITYKNAAERADALAQFRITDGAILLASSMDRGVDLVDDECRVVVVAKMPFPYLGDLQVSARMHSDDGNEWYRVQTVRKLVQMTGRAVRSETDSATTYILDTQFVDNVYKSSKYLFPEWWKAALHFDFPANRLKETTRYDT